MYLTGLDLGSSSVKAIVAETGNAEKIFKVAAVLKQPSVGFRKGVLVDFDETLKALRRIFFDLNKISPKAVKRIFVNVSGAHIRSIPSRGVAAVARADSEIQEDDIDRVSESAQAVNLPPNYLRLHNITREFVVDDVGDIEDPLGMTGTRLESSSLIVAAFAPFVNNLVKCVEMGGGRVEGLIFSPLSASRSVLSKRERELGVMMIDLGFATSSFAVYEENKLSSCGVVPLGSGNVTNDIAIGFKTSIENAEYLKIHHGFALSRDVPRRDHIVDAALSGRHSGISKKFLAEIVEVRLVEILELIHNELVKSKTGVSLPAGVVLVGGGAKIPGITELVEREFKLPVQIGLPTLHDFDIRNGAYEEMLNDPEFACAAGLISWSAGANEKKVRPQAGWLSRFGFLRDILRRISP